MSENPGTCVQEKTPMSENNSHMNLRKPNSPVASPTNTERRSTYINCVKAIKLKLASFDANSVLDAGLEIVGEASTGTSIELLQSLPDVAFLLIKWRFLSRTPSVKKISIHEFQLLQRELWGQQANAAELYKSEAPFLALRTFIMPQVRWQGAEEDELLSLARQRIWFTSGENRKYYEESFREQANIELHSYYKIAFLIATTISDLKSPSIRIQFSDLLIKLNPDIGITEIAAFIKLLSINLQDISNFFEKFRDEDCQVREYFQQSPFNFKPFIIRGEFLQISHKKFVLRALSNTVPDLLKLKLGRKFKEKFGETQEKYIGELLRRTRTKFSDESEVKKIYDENRIKETKISDFVLDDDGRIFIESKALEPNDFFTTCTDASTLKARLDESFTKALAQVQACCFALNKVKKISPLENFALVILHQDFFISNGKTIERDIHPKLTKDLYSQYGEIPFPLTHVYYMGILDLERLLTTLKNTEEKLSLFLKNAVSRDQNPETATLVFSMHIANRFTDSIENYSLLTTELSLAFDEISGLITANENYWNGRLTKYYETYHELKALI